MRKGCAKSGDRIRPALRLRGPRSTLMPFCDGIRPVAAPISPDCRNNKGRISAIYGLMNTNLLFTVCRFGALVARGADECVDGHCPALLPDVDWAVRSPVPGSVASPMVPALPRHFFRQDDRAGWRQLHGEHPPSRTQAPHSRRMPGGEGPNPFRNRFGGSCPRPAVVRCEKNAFPDRLREFKVDAVVYRQRRQGSPHTPGEGVLPCRRGALSSIRDDCGTGCREAGEEHGP